MSEYVKYAKEALSRPDSFMWFGDDDMFHTWGWAGINYTGHENLADISNWYSTIAELKREFGEDAYVENFDETRISHFACGYVYQLRVRILNEDIPHYEITDEDITPYFKFVCDIATYLKYEYPVLDDSDYSDRQWEAAATHIEDWVLGSNVFPIAGNVIMCDGIGNMILDMLHETGSSEWDYLDDGTPVYDNDDITEAIYFLHLDSREDDDNKEFWSEWEMLNPSAVAQRYNEDWRKAGQLKLTIN